MVSVILAGGRNTRFPYPKALIPLDGGTIIERQIALLGKLTGRVIISTNTPEFYFHLGLPMVGDVVHSRWPVSGIYSALTWSGADAVLAVACDMPFLAENLLRYVINHRGGDATVCMLDGRAEPLPGVYAASALGAMQQCALGVGTGSMVGLLQSLDTRYISERDVRALDSEGRSFVNINTPKDRETKLRNSAGHAAGHVS